MNLASAPSQLQEEFANSDGTKTSPIPLSTGTPGAASFAEGFPPECAEPVVSGGIPPSKADMNGILAMMSALDVWMSAGASFKFNGTYATAIGGYPQGSRVLNAAGTGFWISTIDNNSNNPDTGGTGGTGWIPDRAVASAYATAQHTIATGNSKVIWDSSEFDPFGMWNLVSKRFTAIWAGNYRLSGSIYLPAPDGQNMSVMVYKNGALAKQCSQFPQVSNVPLSYAFDAIVSCAAGDFLEAFMNIPTTAVLAGQVGSNQAYVFGQIEFLGS